MNENLLIKKIIFLLIAISYEDGLEDFQAVRNMVKEYLNKKLELPKLPL